MKELLCMFKCCANYFGLKRFFCFMTVTNHLKPSKPLIKYGQETSCQEINSATNDMLEICKTKHVL